eukprot:gene14317-44_t
MAEEEVVMSIEETNRLRASLGLKPLTVGQTAAKPKPKPDPAPAAPADTEALRAKLTETGRLAGSSVSAAQGLMCFNASIVWLLDGQGETVVLTLADTEILDEKGALADGPDRLEDALAVQEKARRKARAAATKTAKPLWEEDGKDGEGDGPSSSQQQQESKQPRAPELEDTGVVGEKAIGKGLAACLSLIKEKGILKDKVQWAGRTNDKKPVALIGLGDVYTGGSHEDAMQQRIETALTQRDEFGRVMTPKERFRVMCHQFHGKPPSKNKQEERQRKYLEELAIARATASDNPSSELDRLRELQKQTGSAFIPLTGRAKPGAAVRDPLADVGAGDASKVPATPLLGGGMTPLSGNKKVEMMLGISKVGAGSMPPPAPRR